MKNKILYIKISNVLLKKMYTYIHTVNNSNATQLQPAQADRDLPSLMDLGQSSDTKTHFSLGSLKQQGLTMQL